ncbi:MAG: TIM barrel protein [Acidobacteriaceae bacterium]|jgi:sugar phosphate isomerase/epimerase|nr:TIM barrel protein [Acidobacteriaceae bacterium]
MTRRQLLALGGTAMAAAAALPGMIPLGINTYCLRSLRWTDAQLLDYCAQLQLDAIFLQDSTDPGRYDPAHWGWVRGRAKELGLHLETGGGVILPRTPAGIPDEITKLRREIERARAMGSPLVRALLASDRAHLPPGSIAQHTETALAIFRAVRTELLDAGMKIGLEYHKDLQAWEMQRLLEAAGRETVGCYLDTGNPVFVMEDPLHAVEVLAPYAITVHLRDSVVYEHPRGIAVQWVPLGEGNVDFPKIVATVRARATGVHLFVKPITGRPPEVLPIYDPAYWERFPEARARDFVRFLALAKRGGPYEGHVVTEDLYGKPVAPQFLSAVQYQQRDHVERGVAYARKTLGLGIRHRASK